MGKEKNGGREAREEKNNGSCGIKDGGGGEGVIC